MYRGEFTGKCANNQNVSILILGESHHWSDDDYNKLEEERRKKEECYTTAEVVERYLENYNNNTGKNRDRAYRFFENIVRTFGVDPNENRTVFWNRVYFGNYIDQLCGVRDTTAKKLLNIEENRKRYNEQLFSFIRRTGIDIVFCFSRRAYDHLPTLENDDREELGEKNNTHRLNKLIYCSGDRKTISEFLTKSVIIYGLRHPSQGYSYNKYQDIINVIRERDCALNKAMEVFEKGNASEIGGIEMKNI